MDTTSLAKSISRSDQPPDARPFVTDARRRALLDLLAILRADDYAFVTATPATHARVVARDTRRRARNLRDVLGWSLPFSPEVIDRPIFDLLRAADFIVERDNGLFAATIRVSSVHGALFVHSAYPTTDPNSVFLGPDSYRFADLILAQMTETGPCLRILDYGAGAGVGGITAALAAGDAHLTLADVNPKALFLASVNAEFAGLDFDAIEVARPRDVKGDFDLVVTHPPFMMDRDQRAYRDGGALYGGQLSLQWTLEAMELLRPGGKLILHTGVSIVDGRDVLLDALCAHVPVDRFEMAYHELDPDIFGDELDQPAYAEVERIAAVGMVLRRRDG